MSPQRFERGFWRAVVRHVLLPVAVLVGFVVTTTAVGWHGPWTDAAIFGLVFVWNLVSISVADWSSWIPGRRIRKDGQGISRADLYRAGFALACALTLFVAFVLATAVVRSG